MRLTYVMKFVADMETAVAFYRDTLGLRLKFQSPGWSEFVTGETTLALHPASGKNPAGTCEIGFSVDDIDAFHLEMAAEGVKFTRPPTDEHGRKLATFIDCDGAEVSLSG
jgi:catechol 2,3-dioxygenase-like lactoylglutathione lyase family enzyme